jgi:Ca2+-binding EF-hand superfamily protein
LTGLFWLFLSYGYVLYSSSNLISEGSELLLLIPSMAGLVGGVVLPLLGAVPDGAIILFSGLGSLEDAQETLSVGVGALAGSTIMLLTVPFALSVYGGRVDLDANGVPDYLVKPKLSTKTSWKAEFTKTGVTLSDAVHHGGVLMALTTVPYFLIQVPASIYATPENSEDVVAAQEHWWAAAGFILCLLGLTVYMRLQLHISQQGQDKGKRMAVMKKLLKQGQVSLSGAIAAQVNAKESALQAQAASEYQSIHDVKDGYPSPAIAAFLKEILADAFYSYDSDTNGQLDKTEVFVFFRDFHESISEEEMDKLFAKFDTDGSGTISLDEFIGLAYTLIKAQDQQTAPRHLDASSRGTRAALVQAAFGEDEDEEEETVPEEFTSLTPDQQQRAIKWKAFRMLALGTGLVVLFSDPMVDVMQEIAVRSGISPFYVSFVLAPLASNASEVIASQYYASKKTRKTITVSLTALEGAACMNNTFCLCIFMGLVFVRGLAWHYTAETVAIVIVEFIIAFIVIRETTMTTGMAMFILALFPLSIVLVAALEAFGLD